MLYQTHKKILALLLTISIILFSGCIKEDKETDNTPTQNEGSSNSNNSYNENEEDDSSNDNSSSDNEGNQNDSSEDDSNSNNSNNEDSQDNSSNDTTYGDKTEHHEVYAERELTIDITAPFEISNSYVTNVINAKNGSAYADVQDKQQIIYKPNNGFIGKDTFSFKFYKKNTSPNENKLIEIEYIVNTQKTPLEGYRDFLLSVQCEDSSLNIDVDIIDNDLILTEKVHDDLDYYRSNTNRLSRIQIDYIGEGNKNSEEYKKSKRHHDIFKRNLNENLLITCNYPQGYKTENYGKIHSSLLNPSKISNFSPFII
jgi:hypothetical protein